MRRHDIVLMGIPAFPTFETLDAQFDEAKPAFGMVFSAKGVGDSEWAQWWGAIDEVDDRNVGSARIPDRPWHFSGDSLEYPGVPACGMTKCGAISS